MREGAILVTTDVVGFYPNIPHDLGLHSLSERLNEIGICKVPTEEFIPMAESFLKNKYFEFNENFCMQIPRTAIGTEFEPPYACIFVDEMETILLKTQQLQPFIWFRYFDDSFFIWTHAEDHFKLLLKDLYEFHPNLKLRTKHLRLVLLF